MILTILSQSEFSTLENSMKKILLPLILSLFCTLTTASDTNPPVTNIMGDWHGQLSVMGTKLRISFHISQQGEQLTTTMDSPDQGAMGIATTSTSFENNQLYISIKTLGAEYKGMIKDAVIEGMFSQAGMEMELVLSREVIIEQKLQARPQDPSKPYPYHSEDVIFNNKHANNIKLAATLTLPNNIKNPTVAIMISGSGPQNRDEEIKAFNHRPFLVWSDYLTRNGIAVLRYDDRGVAESEGTQENATSEDFATDVEAAVEYLQNRQDLNFRNIGLIGHSEGGFIAPMVAAKNKDISFIVLLAGTGVDGATILTTQSRKAAELAGATVEQLKFNEKISNQIFAMVKNESDTSILKNKLSDFLQATKLNAPKELTKDLTEATIKQQVKVLSSNWFNYFIKTNPDDFLSQVNCPVLAINGEKDFQVLPELNLSGIKQSLTKANNKDFTLKELVGLNHLFQTAETGALNEYAKIEETISPVALKIVADWINQRFN